MPLSCRIVERHAAVTVPSMRRGALANNIHPASNNQLYIVCTVGCRFTFTFMFMFMLCLCLCICLCIRRSERHAAVGVLRIQRGNSGCRDICIHNFMCTCICIFIYLQQQIPRHGKMTLRTSKVQGRTLERNTHVSTRIINARINRRNKITSQTYICTHILHIRVVVAQAGVEAYVYVYLYGMRKRTEYIYAHVYAYAYVHAYT